MWGRTLSSRGLNAAKHPFVSFFSGLKQSECRFFIIIVEAVSNEVSLFCTNEYRYKISHTNTNELWVEPWSIQLILISRTHWRLLNNDMNNFIGVKTLTVLFIAGAFKFQSHHMIRKRCHRNFIIYWKKKKVQRRAVYANNPAMIRMKGDLTAIPHPSKKKESRKN